MIRCSLIASIAVLSIAHADGSPPPSETPALSQVPIERRALEPRLSAVEEALTATYLPDLTRDDAIVRATELQAEVVRLRQATVSEPDAARAEALALEAAAGRMVTAAARDDRRAFASARNDAAVALELLRSVLGARDTSRSNPSPLDRRP